MLSTHSCSETAAQLLNGQAGLLRVNDAILVHVEKVEESLQTLPDGMRMVLSTGSHYFINPSSIMFHQLVDSLCSIHQSPFNCNMSGDFFIFSFESAPCLTSQTLLSLIKLGVQTQPELLSDVHRVVHLNPSRFHEIPELLSSPRYDISAQVGEFACRCSMPVMNLRPSQTAALCLRHSSTRLGRASLGVLSVNVDHLDTDGHRWAPMGTDGHRWAPVISRLFRPKETWAWVVSCKRAVTACQQHTPFIGHF